MYRCIHACCLAGLHSELIAFEARGQQYPRLLCEVVLIILSGKPFRSKVVFNELAAC